MYIWKSTNMADASHTLTHTHTFLYLLSNTHNAMKCTFEKHFSKPLMITTDKARLVIATLYQSVPSGVISLSSWGWNYLCVRSWAFQTDGCMPQQQSIILNPKPIYSDWRGKYLLISCRQSLIAALGSGWQSNCAAPNGTFILDLQLGLYVHMSEQ